MINNDDRKIAYRGDGTTTVFPFSFNYVDKENIHVVIYDEKTGEETPLTKDYYIDETAKTVTYPGYAPGQEIAEKDRPAILTKDQTITIYRETEITQLVGLGKKYPLPPLESMSDKLTLICQEMKETLSRSVSASIASGETSKSLLNRIDRSMIWNEDSGNWDAEGRRIVGASQPESAGDVVTLQFLSKFMDKINVGEYNDYFDIDDAGGLMPALNPIYAKNWERDNNGDIMPR